MWRKENPLALLVGMQTSVATLENSMEVLQKVKNRTVLWSSNCTTRYLPKVYKVQIQRVMYPNIYSSIINNKQMMERVQMSINWLVKMWYTYNGILLSHQKEWNHSICNDVDGARVYCTKQNKSVRERQIPYDVTPMWNLRNKTDEHRRREGKIR